MNTAAKMKHIPWKSVERESLNPLIDREMVVGEKMMLARVLMKKGAVLALIRHPGTLEGEEQDPDQLTDNDVKKLVNELVGKK